MDSKGLTPLQWLDMEGPGAKHGVQVAALLGILATALLITEAGALHCHSHSSVLHHDRDGKSFKNSVTLHNSTESCSPSHSACVEAFVTLSTGSTSVTVIQRGCSNEHTKGETETPATPHGFLHIQTHIRYCRSDLCNAKKMGSGSPSQRTAPAPTSSTHCYAGLSLDPEPHSLEQVACDGANARCYHGNGTLITEKLAVPIFLWHCQVPSCGELPTRYFGPVQLSQAGVCCSSSYCNGQGALDPLSKKWHGRKVLSYNLLTSTIPSGSRKGDKDSGNGTAVTAPPHPDTKNATHELNTNPEVTDKYNNTKPVTVYSQTEQPCCKGDTRPSVRPHPHTTKLNKKSRFTEPTVIPKHGPHKSQAPGLHFCPLLVTLAIAGLRL